MKTSAEIVSIGNELLIGHTLDTNSNWIAQQLNRYGWSLQRVTLLRDSLDAISAGIREVVKRAPALLITVGGLGPTHDDMTLKGLSMAIRRPLTLNEKALETMRKKYERINSSTELTWYRRKMALLPRASEPLPNPVGTAPGVLTTVNRTKIFSLPGVPDEMKAIFRSSIIPVLKKSGKTAPQEVYLSLVGIVESALAPVLDEAQSKFPNLYFKSHPKSRETGVRSLIQLHIYTVRGGNDVTIGKAAAFVIKRLTRGVSESRPEGLVGS